MLRITAIDSGPGRTVLHLEGRLTGPLVLELARASEAVLHTASELTLDLDGTSFIDGEGVALLQRLRRRGATVRNCSPFVAEQLREIGDADGASPRPSRGGSS